MSLENRPKILLAVDLRSDAADIVQLAIPWVRALAAVVDLVYVDNSRALFDLYVPPALRGESNQIQHEADERMERMVAGLPDDIRGRGIIDPTTLDAMIDVRTADYAMVLVGTRGRVGLAHLWAGSTAERIVRFCARPVLVLRAHAPGKPLRILFAVDPNEDATVLATALCRLAERLDARIDLLTVHELPTTDDAPLRAKARERLNHLLSTQFSAGVRGDVHVDPGTPVTGILQRAAAYDLVVVGTHGRDGISHAILGSVAERVVRRSDRPVLVLRA